ncbi:MAG: calcium-binding protein [Paracoccus sp. (in: a-proteobacteria)]
MMAAHPLSVGLLWGRIMPLNPNGNKVGTAGGELLWGAALVLGDGSYDNYGDYGNPGAILGYGGNDTIYGDIYYDGDDGIEGDEIRGGGGNDLIYGDDGPQAGSGWKLRTVGAADRIWGDGGKDTIFGEDGNDQIDGGTGHDLLVGGWGSDLLRGGAGDDRIHTDQDVPSVLHATGWFNSAYGGAGNDAIWGGRGVDEFYGDAGNDTLRGLDGNDDLEGGDGRDVIQGGEGDDNINGGGYYGTAADVGDVLWGDAGNDYLNGGYGHDTLHGGIGNDTLAGGDGHDIYDGQAGIDSYDCGAGNDTYWVQGGDVFRFEYADSGIDLLYVDRNWTLGSFHENLTLWSGTAARVGNGNALKNTIDGNALDNVLRGMGGKDDLRGRGGNDILFGNNGRDSLTGDGGNDTLAGGAGGDFLSGGGGADRFVFLTPSDSRTALSARDVIGDFSRAQGDRIDLSQIDARSTVAGNQAFSFIGSAAFDGSAGQLRVQAADGGRLVLGDVNGDGTADFSLFLDDPLNLTASCFLL